MSIKYIEGKYHEYIGGCSARREISASGDIMSTIGMFSTLEGISWFVVRLSYGD